MNIMLKRFLNSLSAKLKCKNKNKGDKKQDEKSLIGVCNDAYCDEFEFDWQTSRQITQIVTSKSGKRFDIIDDEVTDHINHSRDSLQVSVDLTKERQTILGFGGTITDATVINANSLTPKLRLAFIEAYYGRKGLEYTLTRVPIAGTDFSERPYSYNDTKDPDYDLKHWSLAPEDTELKIPFLHDALKIAARDGRIVKLFASSWSPPKWMKDNDSVARGHLKNDTRVYKAYVEYLMKFLDAYKAEKLTFWGATVQNEPITSNWRSYYFNSLQFSKTEQADFIVNYLGPTLEARGYTKNNFKLMVGDDNLDIVEPSAVGLLTDKNVQKYVAAFAYHWYSRRDVPHSRLSEIHDKVKNFSEFFLMTEACAGSESGSKERGISLGNWTRAEDYALDIIEDLRHHTAGWVDWNMALNPVGGPGWAKNFADAPIIVNKTSQEFYKQPMYYALGHFSKFTKPGDVIVESSVTGDDKSAVKVVASIRKDIGTVIITALNKADVDRKIELLIKGSKTNSTFLAMLEARSINTFVIQTM